MKRLREKIIQSDRPVILYELIPPSKKLKQTDIHAYAQCAVELLDSTSLIIDGINIPDIRDEERRTPKINTFVSKTDSRLFAKKLQASSLKHLDIVINRCSVYEEWPEHNLWLENTFKNFDIDNLILVGGESHKIKYVGPSVIEMIQSIKQNHQSFFCGGITIPSRRAEDPTKDEPYRLIEKGLNGLEFFTSQVNYEPYKIQSLLKDYYQLCTERKIKPKRIFLSFAPISSRKDLEFLRWLGVFIPDSVENILFEADIGIGWRSMKIAKVILHKILAFVHDENICVPLGLNVEHISRHNFELSKEFIEELGSIYNHAFETKYQIF